MKYTWKHALGIEPSSGHYQRGDHLDVLRCPQPPKSKERAVDCLPDEDDRHVLAAAILARADTIVTQNTKHFPKECLDKFGVLCQKADDFLIHQYHLRPQLLLDKLDDQAAGISQDRAYVIASLKLSAKKFAEIVEAHTL